MPPLVLHRLVLLVAGHLAIAALSLSPSPAAERTTNGNHAGPSDVGIWYCTYYAQDWTGVVGYQKAKNYFPLCSDKPGDFRHYASNDTAVIDYHLRQIADAKIDFLLLEVTPGGLGGYRNPDWKGDLYMVDCARAVCRRIKVWNDAHAWKIKYALAVCTHIRGDDTLGLAIEKIAKDVDTNFVNNPDYGGPDNFYQLNGKPLMICYGIRLSQLNAEWPAYTGDKTYGNRFTLRTCTGYADVGEYGWPLPLHKGTLLDSEVELVEPGFNVHRPGEVEPRNHGDFYRQCWQKVLDNPRPQIVMIQAFNDYLEESAVWTTDTSKLDETQEKWTDKEGKLQPAMYWDMTKEYIAMLREQQRMTFDRDPGWEGYNNRLVPEVTPLVTQDFGYSRTNFAAKSLGEIGGRITRASEPAWYAARIPAKSLDDKLSASGAFTLIRGGGAICFGWFNGQQPNGMGRPVNSLVMTLSAAKTGGRLAIHLITAQNQSYGTFVTRFERYHTPEERAIKRPTQIKFGTRYHWKLDYDPAANNGQGQAHFTISSGSEKPDDFEGKQFTIDLPASFKKQGTTFDHFGLINVTRPGGALNVYFGDLVLDGRPQDLSNDPHWDKSGNHASYRAKEVGGVHDFGYSATNHAGGTTGEIGGLIWRAPYAYYADRVGPLSLGDRLEARGRFVLLSGAPDSGFLFGWFNSQVKQTDEKQPLKGRNFIGISVGGPTHVGHYFLPILGTAQGRGGRVKEGPIIALGKTYEWTFLYDPAANNGHGQLRLTLGGESVTLDLNGARPADAEFDRFGLFCVGTGGGQAKAYFDDLTYTASSSRKPQ
jgi:hypothetical protein